jgi:hypothetical protein
MTARSAPLASLLLLPLVAAACSGAPDGGAVVDDPSIVRFEMPLYQLQPGEEKRYNCYTMSLPADRETVITEITPTYGKGVHHLGVYYTIALEKEGVFECPELFRETWIPLLGTGIESGTLKLPEGAGFRLPPGTQILVQLHLQNVTSKAIEDRSTIRIKTQDPVLPVVQAGIFGFDNRTVRIPVDAKNYEQAMSCPKIGKDMNVFAVFGHMHKFGRTIDVSRGPGPGQDMLYEAAWVFDEQPTTPRRFDIKKTDDIHVRCRYDNTSGKELTYGESSDTEMCSFVFYYTPYEGLDGCVKSSL